MRKHKINITDPQGNIGNPLLKLENTKYETREDACEAVYVALLDHINRFGCEMVEKAECADFGTLYACDNDGLNSVPLNLDDEPYTREEVLERMACFRDGSELREATADDGCTADVDFVSVNEDNEVVGYYQFVEADYADVCRAFIMRNGYATDDGVTATVVEVAE